MKKPFADDQLTEHLEKIDRVGYTILENLIPRTAVTAMAAAFEPLYRSNLDTIRNNPNRGSMRHYMRSSFRTAILSARI